ncbi:MAG: cation diffusion facilitator family transporter [Mariprofundaceae bacterium]|nr:cation diffusion facilitator family transporter [Mariprofundaceae bacterium]
MDSPTQKSNTATQRLSPEESARWMKIATYASASVACVLIAAKLVAWLWTDSVSLLATLMDSCLDAVASLITLLAVRHALEPADDEHRFGHGKAEALAGLAQSMFITGSALFLLLEASARFFHPQAIEGSHIGIAVMIFSIIMTLGLLTLQRHVVRKTGSTAIAADSLHYKSDLYMNASVILALVLAVYGWQGFDAIFGIGIAFYILYSAYEIIQHAMHDLMDHELSSDERKQIRELVSQHPQAHGMHDLRTRKSGTTVFIQLHLELDDSLTLLDAHTISDQVEATLMAVYPNAEIIIHEDPISAVSISEPFEHTQ